MSPRSSWTAKDERQYRHVLKSERRRGRSPRRAREIAARTVNKQRRAEGRAGPPRARPES
jgi:hypothetical protein